MINTRDKINIRKLAQVQSRLSQMDWKATLMLSVGFQFHKLANNASVHKHSKCSHVDQQKLPKKFMIIETIHLKALVERFLMMPLVFRFNQFLGNF
jgi:hypothetical protein